MIVTPLDYACKRASLWSTVLSLAQSVPPTQKSGGGGGGGGGHRVACASAETVQCLRSQNSLIIDANTQHSDSRHTQADPNLVC